jgi:hypothetical protein
MKKVIIAVAGFFLLSPLVSGGWVIKEQSRFTDTKTRQKRKVYAQDYQIRLDEESLTTFINLNTGVIRFYDPDKKIYWEGTIDDYDHEMAGVMRERFLEKISDYSASQKAEAMKSFDRMLQQLQLPDSTVILHDQLLIQVTQTREGKEVAGYPTRVYTVYVNQIPVEDDWIAPDLELLRLPMLERYYEIFNRITKYYEQGFHYRSHPRYIYMQTRGYPVKVKEYGYGYEVITEVKKARERKLSDSVFKLPGHPQKVTLKELNQQ